MIVAPDPALVAQTEAIAAHDDEVAQLRADLAAARDKCAVLLQEAERAERDKVKAERLNTEQTNGQRLANAVLAIEALDSKVFGAVYLAQLRAEMLEALKPFRPAP